MINKYANFALKSVNMEQDANTKLLKSIDGSVGVIKWLMILSFIGSVINFLAEIAMVK